MTVKRFIGTALFTWFMCWIVATGFSNDPAKLSPVVQTSPRITVQIYTPSEVQGQLYPPTTTTISLSGCCKTKITIQGHLDKKWKNTFEGMKISYEGDNTILTGNLKDEAHMHGVLNIIRDLNIKLLSVNPAE
jgi:hypothetical protein